MRKEKLKKVLTESMLKMALKKPDRQQKAIISILQKRKTKLDEKNNKTQKD